MPKAQRLEDLPPKIQELLKKRGWTWPPTEEMKREWREALERFAGSLSTPYEVLADMAEEDGRWDDYRWYLEQIEKEKKQREGGGEGDCSTSDIP